MWLNVNKRNSGACPALPYSSIQSISSNGVRGANEIKEMEYGEYPQTIVDENYSRELKRAYNNRSLRTTGKNYTTDSVRYEDTDTSFRARTHTEYEYNGSKFIRFVGDSNCDGKVLSDGRTIKTGQAYWVRVEPITWLVDERANIALSKKLIFSGVHFKNVNFSYKSKNKGNIRDISFVAKPNEITALVGHSGSGKTTIINLILRKYQIDSGEVLIDNENIYNYSKEIYSTNVVGVN